MSGNVSLIDGHIDGKQTNYDRIRNMSVEEMAEFILMMAIGYCSGQVPKNIKEWLESEVTE